MGSTSTTYLSISFFILFSILSSSFSTYAATFEIRNQCPFPVWAAALVGGMRLENGQSWTLNVNGGTSGRIWGRTNCNFDGNGNGGCETGDCAGVLECRLSGAIPATLAEYTIGAGGNQDFFDVSLVDGFNLPMDFSGCQSITCSADINRQCPNELRVPGGCRNPRPPGNDGPTDYSRFFKERCPTSYSYPKDDEATKPCPAGTNYRVVFCP